MKRILALSALLLSAAVSHAADGDPLADAVEAAKLPKQELTQELLYTFLLAEIANQRGNLGVAVSAYLDLAKRSRDPRLARRATELANLARQQDLALEAANLWLQYDPESLQARQTVAQLLLNSNRLDEGAPHIERLISNSGRDPAEVFMQLSRVLARQTDKEATLRLVQRVATPHAGLAEARYAVAQAAINAGNMELAESELKQANQLKPDWEPAVLLMAQLMQRQSNTVAIDYLAGFLQKNPAAKEARLSYARLLVSEKRYADARVQFQSLLDSFPDNADVTYAVGVLSFQLSDFAAAEQQLRRLLTLNYKDQNSVRLYLGQIAEEQKKTDEALKWYSEIGRGEHFLGAQIRYANVLAHGGKLDDALKHLDSMASSTPEQRAEFAMAQAQLLRDNGRPQDAFELLGKALEKTPNHPELLYDYAMSAEKLDRVEILEASLRKLIELKPDHAQAYNALGYTLADRNVRLEEARTLIEKALKLSPDDAFITDSMGWVHFRLGNLPEAVEHLRKAFAVRPDPEIAAHLGEVLWKMGKRDEAELLWQDAIKKAPNNETLLGTIKRLKP